MNNKFWDIDDLLMVNEKIDMIAETDICGLNTSENVRNISNELTIINEGNKITVPLWVAINLRNLTVASIKNPKYLTIKYYNYLENDPTITNLKEKNPFFYDICLKLIPYLEDDLKWPQLISNTLYKRYFHLFKNSVDVQYENQTILTIACWKEKAFYEKMVKNSRTVKFYKENYLNNNNSLDEYIEAKRLNIKKKKVN
jgi:hypothetical protein